ncbi:hypothetical protein N9Y55_01535 [bacterium]|nr:hypothetical protein [bacterium]
MTRRILLPSLALGASILFSQAQDAKIDTVAGNGEIGFFGDGGRALEAALHQPFGVVVSPAGDIVFCDTNNHVIRRISRKKRTIETIVGTGEKGWSGDGGPPSEAKLNEPYEIRFHPSGDLYWVERMSHTVRKLDARTNIVSTIAGTGEAGFSGDGGPGTSAAMSQPHSIQFDRSGKRLFVCDIKNHRIRAIDILTGIISTWCGTGKPEATKDGAKVSPDTPLKGPRALDRAPNGDIWLALREGNQLFRIDHVFHVTVEPLKTHLVTDLENFPSGVGCNNDLVAFGNRQPEWLFAHDMLSRLQGSHRGGMMFVIRQSDDDGIKFIERGHVAPVGKSLQIVANQFSRGRKALFATAADRCDFYTVQF